MSLDGQESATTVTTELNTWIAQLLEPCATTCDSYVAQPITENPNQNALQAAVSIPISQLGLTSWDSWGSTRDLSFLLWPINPGNHRQTPGKLRNCAKKRSKMWASEFDVFYCVSKNMKKNLENLISRSSKSEKQVFTLQFFGDLLCTACRCRGERASWCGGRWLKRKIVPRGLKGWIAFFQSGAPENGPLWLSQ